MKKHDALTHVVNALSPQDLSAGGGNKSGDWVNLKNYDSLFVIYQSDAGTAGQDVNVSLRQATSRSGGNAKNLAKGQWFAAQGTTAVDDVFETVGDGAGTFTDDGETICVARVEVTADQLDVDNNFSWVQIRCSDSGNAAGKLGSAVYLLRGARFAIEVPEQKSAV